MAQRIRLTLACGAYEILRPLIEGVVKPDGIELTILTHMDSSTRHWRFLRNNEFDVAEISLSSYLIAKDAGLPFAAIPVFPHRRFRHGFVYVNAAAGIVRPKDLIGRKVGVKSYQATAIVWMRGILEHEYGVPHKSIKWFSDIDEDIAFTPPNGLSLTRVPDNKSIETMLVEGEVDALIHPDLIEPILRKDPRVARLFPNYKQSEIDYFKKTGIFPIMHTVGLKQEVLDAYPWAAVSLFEAFEEAKSLGMRRMENPRIAPLAWYREAWEEQEQILGADPWRFGLDDQNQSTIETMIGYSHEQGMIKRSIPLDEAFASVSIGRKRGKNYI